MRKRKSAEPQSMQASFVASALPRVRGNHTQKKRKILGAIVCLVLLVGVGVGVYLLRNRTTKKPMQTQEVDAKVQQITLSEQAVEQAKSEEEKVLTLLFLGSDYAKNGETDKAISTYEKILEFSPNNEKALAALSTTTYTAKYKEKAEYYLARLIEVIESNPESTSKKSLGLYRKMLTSAKSGEFKPLEEVGQE